MRKTPCLNVPRLNAPRLNDFVSASSTALGGVFDRALNAETLEELRGIVADARAVGYEGLPRLEGLLAAREETEGAAPPPDAVAKAK